MVHFEIPEEWTVATLGNVCEAITGTTPPKNDIENYGNDVPFVKPPQLNDKPINDAPEKLSIKGAKCARILPSNSVLVTCIGNLGRTAINRIPVAFNQQINALIPSKILISSFLYYQAQSPNFRKQLEGLASATTVTIVNKGKFETIQISISPLPEQHRIVAKIEELFSELDKGVEALKTAQQQLKVYHQAVLQWAFEGKLTEEWRKQQKNLPTAAQLMEQIKKEREKQAKANGKKLKPVQPLTEADLARLPELPNGWSWMRLVNVTTDVFDGPFGSHLKSSDYADNGVRVIRLENIGSLEFKDQYKSYVTKEKHETIKKHTVYPGDLVFSSFITENIRVSIVPSYIQEAVNKADCFCIRTDESIIDEKYLACCLSTRTAYQQLVNEIHGATRPRINTTQLKYCCIPYCSVEEQNKITQEIETRLSVADKLEESISQSLQQAEALRQSILKKAFAGKLVPQDPNDEPAAKLLERIKAERAAQPPVKKKIDQTKKDRLRAEYKRSDFPDGLVRGKYSKDV